MAALIVVIACIRIIATYHVFSQTYDEPAHIAAGMEWLDHGTYTLEPLHPPLARIAAAIGPFLAGRRLRSADPWAGGNEILDGDGRYGRNLSLARLGELPFFVLAAFVVWAWSRRLFGNAVAVISVFVFTMLPPIVGHAGLATTDMAAAATCAAALYAFVRWLDQKDVTRSLLLGLTLALAVLSKFTALFFLPACGLALLAWQRWCGQKVGNNTQGRPMRRDLAVGLTAVVTFLLIWSAYRFSFGPLTEPEEVQPYQAVKVATAPSSRIDDFLSGLEFVPIPAPDLLRGMWEAKVRSIRDSRAYFLGRVRYGVCWDFFLVALVVKSPIAFLVLAGTGAAILLIRSEYRTGWRFLAPTVAAVAILLVTMPVKLHLGLRHILVVYPLLSIAAGFGAASLWHSTSHRRWARTTTVLLLGWLLVASVRAHPDYLPYFNELAWGQPERILVDSDLDWGQDLLRLADVLRTRKVDKLAFTYFGTAEPSRHGVPPYTKLVPFRPTTGWIAISLCKLKEPWPEPTGSYSWLEAYKPVALVGRSIRLYNMPATPSDRSGDTHAASPLLH
ncbi:MAG: glycosyltransferase family 39 protein [Terriglobia bacterium]